MILNLFMWDLQNDKVRTDHLVKANDYNLSTNLNYKVKVI